eukprot:scaffold13_cov241-Pinguiococcus_pyrenoidosus.AAC.24
MAMTQNFVASNPSAERRSKLFLIFLPDQSQRKGETTIAHRQGDVFKMAVSSDAKLRHTLGSAHQISVSRLRPPSTPHNSRAGARSCNSPKNRARQRLASPLVLEPPSVWAADFAFARLCNMGAPSQNSKIALYAGTAITVTGILLVLRRRRRLVGLPFRGAWKPRCPQRCRATESQRDVSRVLLDESLPKEPTKEWLNKVQEDAVQDFSLQYSFTGVELVYGRLFGWQPDFIAETRVFNLDIPVRGGFRVNARAFVSDAAGTSRGTWAQTIVLNIHGGGWVFLGGGTHDVVARQLAHRTGAVVVNVDYRKAPGHRYPVPLEDCVDALKFVTSEKGVKILEGHLNCRINAARVFICGDSAGGNLAAATCLHIQKSGNSGLLQRIAGQILIYPCLSRTTVRSKDPNSSYNMFQEGYGLTKEKMEWFWYQYTGVPVDAEGPEIEERIRYAALADKGISTQSLSGLPPVVIMLADHDVLKDDGELYASKLKKAGVNVEIMVVPNTIHGLWDKRALDKSGQRIFLHVAATFIASKLSNINGLSAAPPLRAART